MQEKNIPNEEIYDAEETSNDNVMAFCVNLETYEDFEKNIEILNIHDHDKNIDRQEDKTTEDGRSLSENDTIENLKQNGDSKDTKLDNRDFEDNEVLTSDGQVFKKHRLRQQQSDRYIFDEPPPKKDNININEEDSDTKYNCPICNVICKSKRGISIHISFHEQVQKFTCAQCLMEFVTNKQLIDHKKVHETDDTIFSCQRCEVAYSNIMDYLLHKADHNKPGVIVNCEECGRECKEKKLYKVHLPTHFNFKHNCEICNKAFKNRLACMRHVRRHKNKDKYKCGECDKECNSKSHLAHHTATHTGVKLYQCLYCGKGFYKNIQREIHTRIHTGERPFQCKICKKRFRCQMTHNHKKFICDYCGKVYARKQYLATHMKVHTRMDLLSCPFCNKKFTSHFLLKTHYINRHTTHKPFKCDTCKVSFKRLTHLQRHLKLRKHKLNVERKENEEETGK